MQILAERDHFYCYVLEPGDEALAHKVSRLTASGDAFGLPHSMIEHETREKWDHEFEHGKRRYFALFERDRLIGRAYVDFENTSEGVVPTLTDSLVTKEFRGQKLSYLLFRARLNYLARETSHPEARLFIDNKDPHSPPSKRSAQRHGFVMQDCDPIDDVEFHTRDLTVLRPWARPGGTELGL
jgi:hypothetical protein